MIYVTGDLHGSTDIDKFQVFKEGDKLTKNDYLIILGDFGLLFFDKYSPYYKRQKELLDHLDQKPWTTLWLDGNHENFPLICDMEDDMPMFEGTVGKIKGTNSIYHLKRGEVYMIEGAKFLCVGGAVSIDKNHRIEGLSWWPEELLSVKEIEHCLKNLDKHNWEVDYVITHTCPTSVVKPMFHYVSYLIPCAVADFLEHIYTEKGLKFKHWYFGHWHDEIRKGKFTTLYRTFKKIT